MADAKISALTELTQGNIANADEFAVNDASVTSTKKYNWLSLITDVAAYVRTLTQTLTNKTIDLASNTLTATLAQLNTAVSDADLASLAGTETLSNKTLTAPKIADGGFLADANGNEQLVFRQTASAVNQVEVTNAATGVTGPLVAPGGETNIDLRVSGKGTGKVHAIGASYGDITSYSPSGGGTATLTLQTGKLHFITMPAGNITIALSNESVGQGFVVRILQDGTGSRTVTWFTTIKWAGGSAPTLTTTGSKADTFLFIVTSAGNYDGYIVGQNV